jgi:RNA ligase (TIGR02306 family)
MRKLASIQVIRNIEPIKNADRIEKAQVLGWQVVVKKGEFKKGDIIVYFEIDSVLPKTEWSEFMAPRNYRVKTIKLRKTLSQGLIMPLDILTLPPEIYKEGYDVTDTLNVKKHSIEFFQRGITIGAFPNFIPKTNETRLQSKPELLDQIRDIKCYITTKIDGTSATFAKFNGEFISCSRNCKLSLENNSPYSKVGDLYDLKNRIPEGIAIQGEICGGKIQKNRLELDNHDFFVFNVFNINKNHYFAFHDMIHFCKIFDLKTVPILNSDIFIKQNLEELLELAKGKYEKTKNDREGIVIRSMETIPSRYTFKVINNDYLLKGSKEK